MVRVVCLVKAVLFLFVVSVTALIIPAGMFGRVIRQRSKLNTEGMLLSFPTKKDILQVFLILKKDDYDRGAIRNKMPEVVENCEGRDRAHRAIEAYVLEYRFKLHL